MLLVGIVTLVVELICISIGFGDVLLFPEAGNYLPQRVYFSWSFKDNSIVQRFSIHSPFLAIIPVLRFDSYLRHITYCHILRKTPLDYLSGFHDLISSHQFKLRSLFVPHGDN